MRITAATQDKSVMNKIQCIHKVLQNLPQGEAVILDIDETLLLNAVDKYGELPPQLTEASLPALLNYLKETGHPVILLTARAEANREKTIEQLRKANLSYDVLLHAPKDKGETLALYLSLLSQKRLNSITRLHIIDNEKQNFAFIEEALTRSNPTIKRTYHHYQPSTQILTDTDRSPVFPDTLNHIKKQNSLGGGTKSTFKVEDTQQNQQFVLKFGYNQEQIKVELLINMLYERLGVPVPKIQAYRALPSQLAASLGLKHTATTVQLAEWLEPKAVQDEQAIIKQACLNFAVHALMGNIDACKTDNFIQTLNGQVRLIDAGANFLFRALGEQREEHSAQVSEIESMRDALKNPRSAAWFKKLTEAEIRAQIKDLMDKRNIIEHTIWQASQQLELSSSLQYRLISAFSHRLDDLAKRCGLEIQSFAKRDKAVIQDKIAAGVLHLQRNQEGTLCVLLSQRARHNWCDNFGGKSNAADKSLAYTAKREAKEESNGVLQYSLRELNTASFHDLITHDKQGILYLYRMYVLENNTPINLSALIDAEHSSHHWVSLETLSNALKDPVIVSEEGQSTATVNDVNGKELILFPPLYRMLQQSPIVTLINSLLVPPSTHQVQGTQSLANTPSPMERNNYRPLTSPDQIKADVAETLIKKSRVLNSIKKHPHFFAHPQQAVETGLSQSELHLKAVMGNDFKITASLQDNITLFFDKYTTQHHSPAEKQQLIEQAVELIEYEKAHPDKVFFYHGTSDEVAYAYAVYTAIYQILDANTSLKALRADNALFNQCLSIQDFIAYFENQATLNDQINNYMTGYIECALSTNLFLFGNHNNAFSYTIDYYTSNTTKVEINLAAMLAASLAPMGVSKALIDQITKLAHEFPQKNQGTLYQIILPRNEANKYAYLAKPLGHKNPLVTAQGETTGISEFLIALEMNAVNSNYIQNVQARVMAPPSAPINIRNYHWGTPIDKQIQTNFEQRLEQLAQNCAYEVLLHYNPLSALNKKTALTRNLLTTYKQAGLNPSVTAISDELVIQLIEASDFQSIISIITAYPEYKSKPLIKKLYTNLFMGSEPQTLLERLLAVPNAAETIHIIYGEHFYEGKLNILPLHQVVAAIQIDKRFEFLSAHQDKITNGNRLESVLSPLPETSRLKFASVCSDKILTCGELVRVLDALPEINRLEFAAANQNKIQTCYELEDVLSVLPETNKLEFATKNQHLIEDGYELGILLCVLSKKDRFDFATRNQDKITSGQQLWPVLIGLVVTRKLEFAITHQDKIKDGYELGSVLRVLPQKGVFDFATKNQNKITNGRQLSSVLINLDETRKLEFAIAHQDKIEDGCELASVIRALPKADKVKFATANQAKIKNHEQLPYLLCALSEDEKQLFNAEYQKTHEDDSNTNRPGMSF